MRKLDDRRRFPVGRWRESIGTIAVVLLCCAVPLRAAGLATLETAAQQPTATRVVSGSVRDAGGSPLRGAAVEVRGLQQGVNTDNDGRFTLTIPVQSGPTVLVVSYIGKTTRAWRSSTT